jgi:hypothetical protein
MNILRSTFTLLIISCACSLSAQNPIRKETFYLFDKGDTTHITTALSADNFELNTIKLDPVNFPTVTLPRSILEKVVVISNRKGNVSAAMLEENLSLRERNDLNTREIATLRSIMAVQQKNVETCEQTNLLLNSSIQSLNGQLEQTRGLAKQAVEEKTKGKFWAILIGGGIGFGLGAILGIVAAK